eukprot:Nk52_evm27s255 gene=Nk52_evmTU27s255
MAWGILTVRKRDVLLLLLLFSVTQVESNFADDKTGRQLVFVPPPARFEREKYRSYWDFSYPPSLSLAQRTSPAPVTVSDSDWVEFSEQERTQYLMEEMATLCSESPVPYTWFSAMQWGDAYSGLQSKRSLLLQKLNELVGRLKNSGDSESPWVTGGEWGGLSVEKREQERDKWAGELKSAERRLGLIETEMSDSDIIYGDSPDKIHVQAPGVTQNEWKGMTECQRVERKGRYWKELLVKSPFMKGKVLDDKDIITDSKWKSKTIFQKHRLVSKYLWTVGAKELGGERLPTFTLAAQALSRIFVNSLDIEYGVSELDDSFMEWLPLERIVRLAQHTLTNVLPEKLAGRITGWNQFPSGFSDPGKTEINGDPIKDAYSYKIMLIMRTLDYDLKSYADSGDAASSPEEKEQWYIETMSYYPRFYATLLYLKLLLNSDFKLPVPEHTDILSYGWNDEEATKNLGWMKMKVDANTGYNYDSPDTYYGFDQLAVNDVSNVLLLSQGKYYSTCVDKRVLLPWDTTKWNILQPEDPSSIVSAFMWEYSFGVESYAVDTNSGRHHLGFSLDDWNSIPTKELYINSNFDDLKMCVFYMGTALDRSLEKRVFFPDHEMNSPILAFTDDEWGKLLLFTKELAKYTYFSIDTSLVSDLNWRVMNIEDKTAFLESNKDKLLNDGFLLNRMLAIFKKIKEQQDDQFTCPEVNTLLIDHGYIDGEDDLKKILSSSFKAALGVQNVDLRSKVNEYEKFPSIQKGQDLYKVRDRIDKLWDCVVYFSQRMVDTKVIDDMIPHLSFEGSLSAWKTESKTLKYSMYAEEATLCERVPSTLTNPITPTAWQRMSTEEKFNALSSDKAEFAKYPRHIKGTGMPELLKPIMVGMPELHKPMLAQQLLKGCYLFLDKKIGITMKPKERLSIDYINAYSLIRYYPHAFWILQSPEWKLNEIKNRFDYVMLKLYQLKVEGKGDAVAIAEEQKFSQELHLLMKAVELLNAHVTSTIALPPAEIKRDYSGDPIKPSDEPSPIYDISNALWNTLTNEQKKEKIETQKGIPTNPLPQLVAPNIWVLAPVLSTRLPLLTEILKETDDCFYLFGLSLTQAMGQEEFLELSTEAQNTAINIFQSKLIALRELRDIYQLEMDELNNSEKWAADGSPCESEIPSSQWTTSSGLSRIQKLKEIHKSVIERYIKGELSIDLSNSATNDEKQCNAFYSQILSEQSFDGSSTWKEWGPLTDSQKKGTLNLKSPIEGVSDESWSASDDRAKAEACENAIQGTLTEINSNAVPPDAKSISLFYKEPLRIQKVLLESKLERLRMLKDILVTLGGVEGDDKSSSSSTSSGGGGSDGSVDTGSTKADTESSEGSKGGSLFDILPCCEWLSLTDVTEKEFYELPISSAIILTSHHLSLITGLSNEEYSKLSLEEKYQRGSAFLHGPNVDSLTPDMVLILRGLVGSLQVQLAHTIETVLDKIPDVYEDPDYCNSYKNVRKDLPFSKPLDIDQNRNLKVYPQYLCVELDVTKNPNQCPNLLSIKWLTSIIEVYLELAIQGVGLPTVIYYRNVFSILQSTPHLQLCDAKAAPEGAFSPGKFQIRVRYLPGGRMAVWFKGHNFDHSDYGFIEEDSTVMRPFGPEQQDVKYAYINTVDDVEAFTGAIHANMLKVVMLKYSDCRTKAHQSTDGAAVHAQGGGVLNFYVLVRNGIRELLVAQPTFEKIAQEALVQLEKFRKTAYSNLESWPVVCDSLKKILSFKKQDSSAMHISDYYKSLCENIGLVSTWKDPGVFTEFKKIFLNPLHDSAFDCSIIQWPYVTSKSNFDIDEAISKLSTENPKDSLKPHSNVAEDSLAPDTINGGYYVRRGVEFTDVSLEEISRKKEDECPSLCDNNSDCVGYVWTSDTDGTCALKGDIGSTIQKREGAVSGSLCGFHYNVEFSGTDIGSETNKKAHECCSLCKKKTDCEGFAWTEHSGGTCWFKKSVDSSTPMGYGGEIMGGFFVPNGIGHFPSGKWKLSVSGAL